MAFIELKEVVEHIASRERLEVFIEDGTPIDITQALRITIDALPSPGVNPIEGSPKCSCGKLGLGRRSRLPAL